MNELIWPITYLILIIGFAPIVWFEAIKPLIQKIRSKRNEQSSPRTNKGERFAITSKEARN